MGIDLGGFGKEYAVDQVIELAKEHEISSALVNLGGDVRSIVSTELRFLEDWYRRSKLYRPGSLCFERKQPSCGNFWQLSKIFRIERV